MFDIISSKKLHIIGLRVPINPLFSEKKHNIAHFHPISFLSKSIFTRWALRSPLHDGLYP